MSECIADARKEFERTGEISNHAENLIEEAERLTQKNQELIDMLERVMSNYQVAAGAADKEGYATDYLDDAPAVKDLLTKIKGK